MLLLSRAMVEGFFTMDDAIQADKDAFKLFSEGKIDVPLRTQLPTDDGNGDFLCMPAYCGEQNTSSVKILNMFPKNIDKGLPSINAQVMVMNTETGLIDAMIDGNYITQLRTGAASGAAIDLLAKESVSDGALIGTGGQAETQLEAMLAARDLETVRVNDLNFERAKNFVEKMSKKLAKYKTNIIAVETSDEAVEKADVIITVTPSKKPVFDGNKVKAGATVCGVGSFQPDMQETPSELVSHASKIYFDSEEAVLSESGDLLIPLKDKTITKDKFAGDLGEVVSGKVKGRENDQEIIFFKTVGIAAQDLITADRIYKKAQENNVGLEWQ
ncbi:ornithine cyclodeaminase family protein [Companilactobacillus mishanensis]|uniref:Ornithine cyclodeaminase family protein n=1 Tax=Companilactobacillus mishanensis TaxID=2486008 RepID=A0ABW9P728_9LACO|nr:ornithine cyclodeaminase family protein [Companilactobacillus mishanensis]MQS44971.1 ornithine cyclodeaminase family protein [Companilactobacillus mishanensis]